jgi:hypothetical protein
MFDGGGITEVPSATGPSSAATPSFVGAMQAGRLSQESAGLACTGRLTAGHGARKVRRMVEDRLATLTWPREGADNRLTQCSRELTR